MSREPGRWRASSSNYKLRGEWGVVLPGAHRSRRSRRQVPLPTPHSPLPTSIFPPHAWSCLVRRLHGRRSPRSRQRRESGHEGGGPALRLQGHEVRDGVPAVPRLRARAQVRELPRMKLGVISLGCDKATVDSERLVAELVGHGAVVTPDLPRADVILVNTCGFIDAAKRESIDAMLAAAKLKADGAVKAVVAVGCLVQRYEKELKEEIPEVDLFLGFSDLHRLVPELAQRGL